MFILRINSIFFILYYICSIINLYKIEVNDIILFFSVDICVLYVIIMFL